MGSGFNQDDEQNPPTKVVELKRRIRAVAPEPCGVDTANFASESRNVKRTSQLIGPSAWMHTIAFVVILALTVYVIRDLEFPCLQGLVGMNDIDNVMVDLRKSMH